jgi:hypothetical protein
MAKSNFAINAVGGGEVSPKFYGRFDTNPYPQGCEEVTNCIVFPQGGAGTRPGTMIVNQITQAVYPAGAVIGVTSVAGQLIPGDAFTDTRVFPFLAADGTRIQIVAKNRCPFFFEWIGTANGASAWYGLDIESGFQYQVKCDPDELFMNYQSGANAATEYDMDAQGINLQEVQYVQTGNRIYFIHKKMRTFYLQFNQVPSVPVAYFSMGFLIGLRASDAFSDSQKLDNSYKVSFQNPVQPPLSPTGTTKYKAFTITTSSPTYDASLQVTISITAGLTYLVLHAGWVGRYLRFSNASTTAMFIIISVNVGAQTMVGQYIAGVLPTGTVNYAKDANTNWELSHWGGSQGWPAAGTFFQGRLYLGGGLNFPDTFWGSRVNNVEFFSQRLFVQDARTNSSFTDPITTSTAFSSQLLQDTISDIRWMTSGQNISCGTNTREFVIEGSDPSQTISFLNLGSTAQTPHGSAYVQPCRIENTVGFLQRHRRSLREITYSLSEQSFKADDISIFAEHMAEKSGKLVRDTFTPVETFFVQMQMQQVPNGLIWVLDNDGVLSCLTRERTQQVQSWHRHEIAGDGMITVGGVDIPYKPRVRSISVIQRSLTGRIFTTQDIGTEEDELWMTVARGTGTAALGYTKKFYVEMLAPFWRRTAIEKNWITNGTAIGVTSPPNWRLLTPVYMDSAWVMDSGSAFNVDLTLWQFQNIPFRVGATVSVNLQGHDLGEYVVQFSNTVGPFIDISDKAPDLILPASWGIIIGYKYTSRVTPVVSEIQQPTGVSHGEMQKIASIIIHFLNTIACTVGRATSEWDPVTPIQANYDQVNFPLPTTIDQPRPMYSGERKVEIPAAYETRPRFVIQNDRPLPMNFTHVIVKRVINES